MKEQKVSILLFIASICFSMVLLAFNRSFGLRDAIVATSLLVLMAYSFKRSALSGNRIESVFRGALCASLILIVIDFLALAVIRDRVPALVRGDPFSARWLRLLLWSLLTTIFIAIDILYQRRWLARLPEQTAKVEHKDKESLVGEQESAPNPSSSAAQKTPLSGL